MLIAYKVTISCPSKYLVSNLVTPFHFKYKVSTSITYIKGYGTMVKQSLIIINNVLISLLCKCNHGIEQTSDDFSLFGQYHWLND